MLDLRCPVRFQVDILAPAAKDYIIFILMLQIYTF